MSGHPIEQRSQLYHRLRAGSYRNDPYIWFSPYSWTHERTAAEPGRVMGVGDN